MTETKRQIAVWTAVVTAAVVLPGTALAGKGGGDGEGDGHRGRRHGRGDASGLTVEGRAMSRGDNEGWAMEVRARSVDEGDTFGLVRWGHRSEEMAEGLEGEVECLSNDGGVVHLTGTIRRGGAHAGGDHKRAPEGGEGHEPGDGAEPSEAEQLLLGVVPVRDGHGGHGGDSGAGPDEGGDGRHRHGRRGGELAGKAFAFTIEVGADPQAFSAPTIGEPGTIAACSAGGERVPVTRGGFRATETEGR